MKCIICNQREGVECYNGCCSRSCFRFLNRRNYVATEPIRTPKLIKIVKIVKIVKPKKIKKVKLIEIKLEPLIEETKYECIKCDKKLTDEEAYEHDGKYFCLTCARKEDDKAYISGPFIGSGVHVIRSTNSYS